MLCLVRENATRDSTFDNKLDNLMQALKIK